MSVVEEPTEVEIDELARYQWELSHLTERWEAPADEASAQAKEAHRRNVHTSITRPERGDLRCLLALVRRAHERGMAEGREEAAAEHARRRDWCLGCGNEFTTEGGDIPPHRCNGEARR